MTDKDKQIAACQKWSHRFADLIENAAVNADEFEPEAILIGCSRTLIGIMVSMALASGTTAADHEVAMMKIFRNWMPSFFGDLAMQARKNGIEMDIEFGERAVDGNDVSTVH